MAYLKLETKSNNVVYIDAESGTFIVLNRVQKSVSSNNMTEQFYDDNFELIEEELDKHLVQ